MILEMAREEIQGREEMKQSIEAAVRDAKCLVFFEDGPCLRGRLEDVLGQEAVLIPLNEQSSAFISGALRGEMQRLSGTPFPLSLMFVGHSGVVDEAGQAATNSNRGYERWVDGATRVERQLQESKARFAKLVESLMEQILQKGNDSEGSVQLQAVFYHAAAGLFLDYDWEQREFRSLLESLD
jgi:hypothetical protein